MNSDASFVPGNSDNKNCCIICRFLHHVKGGIREFFWSFSRTNMWESVCVVFGINCRKCRRRRRQSDIEPSPPHPKFWIHFCPSVVLFGGGGETNKEVSRIMLLLLFLYFLRDFRVIFEFLTHSPCLLAARPKPQRAACAAAAVL